MLFDTIRDTLVAMRGLAYGLEGVNLPVSAQLLRDAADRLERAAADEHLHFADDDRGLREVYVDGVLVHGVTFADTHNGIVRAWVDGKPGRGERELHGKVEVRFL